MNSSNYTTDLTMDSVQTAMGAHGIVNWLFLQFANYQEMRPHLKGLNLLEQGYLYGPGAFDSLQLVDFIFYVEDAFFADFGKRILLADGAAFSRKQSPYKNIDAFASFIQQKTYA